jgi:hypothetical protein
LLDYYDFFEMLDEPKILANGRPNFVNIIYHSLLYPVILLRGFFEPATGLTVSEDSRNPAGVTWQGTFRVRETNPPFYDSFKLQRSWYSSFTPFGGTIGDI